MSKPTPEPEAATMPMLCRLCGRPHGKTAVYCGGCGARVQKGPDDAFEVEATEADPLIGRVVADRYEIKALLGRGGMGVVYLVEHVHIGKSMAMKLLHGELARNKSTLKRFRLEAEAVSRLKHHNTVQLFDYGRDEGLVYLVMEYLDGRDLGQIVKRDGPLEFRQVAALAEQVASSVQEAHEQGIVHRDLKPENIMVLGEKDSSPRAKVLDFGLAKLREADSLSHMSITRAGAVVGTPYYMSPEQIRGEELDGRADVYSLGAVMYRAVTGVPPFRSSSPMGVLTMHLQDPVVPPSKRVQGGLSPHVDSIILKALEKDPAARFRDMNELRDSLLRFLVSEGERESMTTRVRDSIGKVSGRKTSADEIRGQLDRYERRLRRRGLLLQTLLAILVGASIVAGAYFWDPTLARQMSSVEIEPNDALDQALNIPAGEQREGYLGARQAPEQGDQDLWRIENPGPSTRPIRIRVTEIPNMDIEIDIYRAGFTNPLLSSNGQADGHAEAIIGFPISASSYLIGVRERRVVGRFPIENVSDAYRISWSFVDPPEDGEREFNDTIAQAEELDFSQSRRGHIGWEGDRDVYCLLGADASFRVELTAIEELDLKLTLLSRDGARRTVFDQGGLGEPEETEVIEAERAADSCFEVTVAPLEFGARMSLTAYELRLVALTGDGEAAVPD